jgi:2-keto-myo-inositol isomerase
MRSRFCLNTATIKKAPLEQQIRLASSAGFQRIGLWLDDIEETLKGGTSLETISMWIQNAGLKVEELCFLGGWQEAEEETFPVVLQTARQLCRVASLLHCDIVVAVPALHCGSVAHGPARFRSVCEVASEYRLRVALEFPAVAAEVKDLPTAMKLVSEAGCENGGLVLDSFHFHLGGSRLEDLNEASVKKIFLVHLSDAMAVSPEKLRIHHDFRTFPGEGTLDFASLLERLKRLGYEGALSLEVWNQQMLKDDPWAVVQHGFESVVKLGNAWGRSKEGSLPSR